MKTLQTAIDEFIESLPNRIVAEIAAKKLEEQGFTLSERQRRSILQQLSSGQETLRLRTWRFWQTTRVDLSVTSADLELAERTYKELLETIPEFVTSATETTAGSILADLRRRWRAESRAQRRDVKAFRARLYNRWKVPLEMLRMMITISRELAESISNEATDAHDDAAQVRRAEILGRLHARALQIAEEIVCLLEGGFADGAMARWRTLHEVAVIALFISDNEEDLAERYVEHQCVEAARGAREYVECQPVLNFEPLGEAELQNIREACERAIAKYGNSFRTPFGWAAHHLGNPEPNFTDIERAVGTRHLRPFYRMASHNVHANPRGAFYRLGLLDESDVLLAGASDVGLDEPGQCTALSLAQVSIAHGRLMSTIDENVTLKIISGLVGEIAEAFVSVGRSQAERA